LSEQAVRYAEHTHEEKEGENQQERNEEQQEGNEEQQEGEEGPDLDQFNDMQSEKMNQSMMSN
jgi:hypothetical protein